MEDKQVENHRQQRRKRLSRESNDSNSSFKCLLIRHTRQYVCEWAVKEEIAHTDDRERNRPQEFPLFQGQQSARLLKLSTRNVSMKTERFWVVEVELCAISDRHRANVFTDDKVIEYASLIVQRKDLEGSKRKGGKMRRKARIQRWNWRANWRRSYKENGCVCVCVDQPNDHSVGYSEDESPQTERHQSPDEKKAEQHTDSLLWWVPVKELVMNMC